MAKIKTVQNLAPAWLKNVSRIEALLFAYFIALLGPALLEREVRNAMARDKVDSLPLYPETRDCWAPSTERILDFFPPLHRHRLYKNGRLVEVFEPELGALHRQILQLLHISPSVFRISGKVCGAISYSESAESQTKSWPDLMGRFAIPNPGTKSGGQNHAEMRCRDDRGIEES